MGSVEYLRRLLTIYFPSNVLTGADGDDYITVVGLLTCDH